jgi:hypothetical protein
MKRFFGIFVLSKNEQRVVLIVMLVLLAVAFIGYQRRGRHFPVHPAAVVQAKRSPTPVLSEDGQ